MNSEVALKLNSSNKCLFFGNRIIFGSSVIAIGIIVISLLANELFQGIGITCIGCGGVVILASFINWLRQKKTYSPPLPQASSTGTTSEPLAQASAVLSKSRDSGNRFDLSSHHSNSDANLSTAQVPVVQTSAAAESRPEQSNRLDLSSHQSISGALNLSNSQIPVVQISSAPESRTDGNRSDVLSHQSAIDIPEEFRFSKDRPLPTGLAQSGSYWEGNLESDHEVRWNKSYRFPTLGPLLANFVPEDEMSAHVWSSLCRLRDKYKEEYPDFDLTFRSAEENVRKSPNWTSFSFCNISFVQDPQKLEPNGAALAWIARNLQKKYHISLAVTCADKWEAQLKHELLIRSKPGEQDGLSPYFGMYIQRWEDDRMVENYSLLFCYKNADLECAILAEKALELLMWDELNKYTKKLYRNINHLDYRSYCLLDNSTGQLFLLAEALKALQAQQPYENLKNHLNITDDWEGFNFDIPSSWATFCNFKKMQRDANEDYFEKRRNELISKYQRPIPLKEMSIRFPHFSGLSDCALFRNFSSLASPSLSADMNASIYFNELTLTLRSPAPLLLNGYVLAANESFYKQFHEASYGTIARTTSLLPPLCSIIMKYAYDIGNNAKKKKKR